MEGNERVQTVEMDLDCRCRFPRLLLYEEQGEWGMNLGPCIEKKRPWGDTRLNGVRMGQHRKAWILANGPIPDGLYVLHKCDNGKCVNVDHLFLGTQLDNVRDCMAKGRGNRIGRPMRFTEEQRVYALARLLVGESQRSVAKFFGVDASVISRLWTGGRMRKSQSISG